MRLFAIKALLLVVGFSIILVLLYIQSRQASNEQFYQADSLIHEIVSLDASMERDVLKAHVGLLHHYDSITHSEKQLKERVKKLGAHFGTASELRHVYDELEKSIIKQSSELDLFKRDNALYRNSLRYFPVAIRESIVDRPDLLSYLTHLHNDLLQAASFSERETLSHLKKYIDELKGEGLLSLAKHLQLMIERSARAQAEVSAFIDCGTSENAAALLRAYEAYHESKMQKAEKYRMALVLFSALLLFSVVFIMYRLNRAATELRDVNQELKYQKRALDEHAIVAVTDHQGYITYANQKFCELSGYSQDELLGQNHRILKSGHHPDAYYKELWRTISSGHVWHGEIKNKTKSGGYYWVDATIVPFLHGNGKPYKYVAIRSDITARKETEEQQKKLTASFYYAAEALMITDYAGVVEHANPAFEKMSGYSSDEMAGQSVEILRSGEHDEGFYSVIVDTLSRGEVWKGEAILLCKDRSEKITLRSIAPVLDDEGNVINHITFMTDITEEKILRTKVEHTQRLESLGVMAGGIAHDFNNILTSIMGNAKLAESKLTGGNRQKSPYLQRISKASERAADLCRQMLSYSGQGNIEVRPINLSELVHEIASLLQVSVGQNATIQYHLGKNVPSIEADTGQLQQVIMNLITNAAESYPDATGDVEVDVGKMFVDEAWLNSAMFNEGVKEGEYVYLEVKDHGIGMSEETVSHIFEPFFTTKFTGRGLGMSAMMGIVKAHHGAIYLHTEEGAGTLVRVVFPIVSAQAEPLAMAHAAKSIKNEKLTILVVDDEPDILELVTAILTDMSHNVVSASSGEEAIKLFTESPDKIDAVITDATMPGMGGEELCVQLRAMDANVKLILSSGYDADKATQNIQPEVLNGFIQKPYSPEKFAHEVLTILS